MRMVDLIIKKRNGIALTKEEIEWIIASYVKGEIPDYQMSAFLMAIYFRGMSDEEELNLTFSMLHSGEVVDLSSIEGIKCDKHSTGGVGDKTSLVVAPIAAACGVKMAKMSGRGLGHTGGTLDKIEAIPGCSINIEKDDFFKEVNDIGLAIIGQTANIAPADKLMYALRDVTGTIESIPLIASSIMSKKLASGADVIVLDIKVGSGAFMKNVEDATLLAKEMVKIGKLCGKCVVATLTDMSEPLGDAVGNALEVIEAIETLKGRGPKDFSDLCKAFAVEIVMLAGFAKTEKEATQMVEDAISSGRALEKLEKMIEYQKGNPKVCSDYMLFKQAKKICEVHYFGEDAYVESLDALSIGVAASLLGAGRETLTDSVDPSVGIVLNKKIGDTVKSGDLLAKLYVGDKNPASAIKLVTDAFKYSLDKVEPHQKILGVIR